MVPALRETIQNIASLSVTHGLSKQETAVGMLTTIVRQLEMSDSEIEVISSLVIKNLKDHTIEKKELEKTMNERQSPINTFSPNTSSLVGILTP